MKNKIKKKDIFTKVYKRESKSPYDDHNTILLLANCLEIDKDNVNLSYERYIYLHRSENGVICGISVSKQILAENPEFEDNRYMEGFMMHRFLLLHISEIFEFCNIFQEQFIELFLLPPLDYFTAVEEYWSQVVAG